MTDASVGRYWHTIRQLDAAQLLHRVRLRTQRRLYTSRPGSFDARFADGCPTDGRWPTGFVPLDRAVDHAEMTAGDTSRSVFGLLDESVDVDQSGWRSPDHTQLFRYHLNYFEWVWPLAAEATTEAQSDFARLWRSWEAEAITGRWDEWSPYVASLRSWAMCGVFEQLGRGTDVEAELIRHQQVALGFLARNLELDVGGNHLIKNLKAVIGLSVFFGEREELDRALRHLAEQLDRQILSDGGHFELSPSYHVQVMADIVDIVGLCEAAGIDLGFDGEEVLRRMAKWLAAMSFPDGTLPLLGDGAPPLPGVLPQLRERVPAAKPDRLTVLADSGYVCLRQGHEVMAVIDFGHPCPPELPAHAQADWGTFELWAAGARVVLDPGTSTYVGERRAIERSTLAHNTVSVAGRNQTDVWGSFRAGKRAAPSAISATTAGNAPHVEASLTDIHGILHRRQVELTPEALIVCDSMPAAPDAVSTLTLSLDVDPAAITAKHAVSAEPTTVAAGFGALIPALRLTQPLIDGRAEWTIPLALGGEQ